MKCQICVLFLVARSAGAVEFPEPRHDLASCENRWFLKEGQDSEARMLGFAYVDPTAGVTFEVDGQVINSDDGGLVRKPFPLENKARVIMRATANFRVACLSDDEVEALGLPLVPDWLKHYKDDRAPGPHEVAWASFYNEIGAFERALELLQQADNHGYGSTQLSLEKGFALNAMSRFQDASLVLETAVKQNPHDGNALGELAYSYIRLGEFKKAIPLYEAALSLETRRKSGRRAEFAQNLSVAYSAVGDEKSANKWGKKAAKWKGELVPK